MPGASQLPSAGPPQGRAYPGGDAEEKGTASRAGLFLMADLPDLGMGQRVQNGATGVRMTIITGGHIHILHVSAAPTCC